MPRPGPPRNTTPRNVPPGNTPLHRALYFLFVDRGYRTRQALHPKRCMHRTSQAIRTNCAGEDPCGTGRCDRPVALTHERPRGRPLPKWDRPGGVAIERRPPPAPSKWGAIGNGLAQVPASYIPFCCCIFASCERSRVSVFATHQSVRTCFEMAVAVADCLSRTRAL